MARFFKLESQKVIAINIIFILAWSFLTFSFVPRSEAEKVEQDDHDHGQAAGCACCGPAEDETTAEEISDKQLEKAVDIYLKIADIYEELRNDLRGVENEKVIEERIEEAGKAISASIKEADMEEEQYIHLMNSIEADETLLKAFIRKLREKDPVTENRRTQPPPLDPEEVTERQIEQAAMIYTAVQTISERLQKELVDVEDEAVIRQTVATAETEILQAAEDAGMEPEEYEKVIRTMLHDQRLLKLFLEKIEQ